MIQSQFQAILIKSGGRSCRIPFPVNLEYDAADPLAVTMVFCTDDGEIPWKVSYDLLVDATTSSNPTGEGDIQFRREGPYLFVCVNSPEGHSDCAFPIGPVQDFLNQSEDDAAEAVKAIPQQLDTFIKEVLGGR